MTKSLYKLFSQQLGLSADVWMILAVVIVVLAFAVTLVIGLVSGKLKSTKAAMKLAISQPTAVVSAMKRMPADIKAQYKNARLGNIRPSMLVTEDLCVDKPYKSSLVSKVWLVTFVATLVCAVLAYAMTTLAVAGMKLEEVTDEEQLSALEFAPMVGMGLVAIVGGLLTLVGAIVGKVVHDGAVGTYEKFVHALDGDKAGASPAMSEPQQVYAEPQQQYAEPQTYSAEPQQAYAEPQQEYTAEPQQVYAEPQQDYAAEPQQVYAEAQPQQDRAAEPVQATAEAQPSEPVMVTPQESDEEIRRKAREEALAQARAQAMEAQRQAQAEAQAQAQAAAASSVDDVIERIEKIDREGASRETMREVATLLQKERAKPENKTPEQQKRLNAALSKLLKAMSAASRK